MKHVIHRQTLALLAALVLLAGCAKESMDTQSLPPLVRHEQVTRAAHGGERVYNGSIQAGNESKGLLPHRWRGQGCVGTRRPASAGWPGADSP